jgi:hypothetical protein
MLEKEEQEMASGSNVKTSPVDYEFLMEMMTKDPDRFVREDLSKYQLSLQDRKSLAEKKHPDKLDEALTLQQQLSSMHRQIGIDGKDMDEERGMFDMKISEAVRVEQKEKGRRLNEDERQKIIDRMVISGEVLTGKFWLADPNKRYYQVYGTPEMQKWVPFITEDDEKKVRAMLQKKGVASPTSQQIADVYRRWKGL